jgi:hypothetical protein
MCLSSSSPYIGPGLYLGASPQQKSHHLAVTVPRAGGDGVLQHRHAADRHERLRPVQRERAQARAKAADEDQRLERGAARGGGRGRGSGGHGSERAVPALFLAARRVFFFFFFFFFFFEKKKMLERRRDARVREGAPAVAYAA